MTFTTMEDELKYLIALTCINRVGSIKARLLIDTFGTAKNIFEADTAALLSIPQIGQALVDQLHSTRLLERAEKELQFIQDHHIKTLVYGQDNYPKRLMECPDAPAILYLLGNVDLESRHTLSIVGTRNCTQYGRDMVLDIVSDLKNKIPDLVIISGLALGIDISAHRAALANSLPTVGVVAHGLDRIYPTIHRDTASQMISSGGGIITEYITGTEPERGNFLARNRIIAGLSDGVIVAESKNKGGSLVTASIALDYNREVLAFPGRIGDARSEGCNRLIRLNRAGLITCAQDLIDAMNWDTSNSQKKAIQHSIPFEEENLSPNARLIIDALRDRGDMLLSQLSDATNLDHASLYEELLDLEMNGKLRSTPGGLYQLK